MFVPEPLLALSGPAVLRGSIVGTSDNKIVADEKITIVSISNQLTNFAHRYLSKSWEIFQNALGLVKNYKNL